MSTESIKDTFRQFIELASTRPLTGFRRLLDYLISRTGVDPSWEIKLPLVAFEFMEQRWPAIRTDSIWFDPERVHDPLGELAEELRLVPSQPSIETLEQRIGRLTHEPTPYDQEQPFRVVRVHEPYVGVGRTILVAHRRFGERAVYTGLCHKAMEYRIALINFKLHGVVALIFPVFFERVDPAKSEDWGWANQLMVPPSQKTRTYDHASPKRRRFTPLPKKKAQAKRNPYKQVIRLKK